MPHIQSMQSVQPAHSLKSIWSWCFALLVVPAVSTLLQAGDETSWLTGEEFHQRLESRIGIQWAQMPLRQGLR
ncbi:MAG: hypothetical protein KDA60_11130, partial [Planctomycetales bacterium]|nr:hypothetical protein [Planctomycetales bacterium]